MGKVRTTGILFLMLTVSAVTSRAEESVLDNTSNPPGQLFDVGNYRMHLYCTGTGSPTVILDAGIGGFSLEWASVQRQLPENLNVCAYDRAGYGWSDPGPTPRTTVRIVEELDRLLHQAQIAPPYILVGHSFGGYNMLYFAKSHPAETAGIVLVDSSHPEQIDRLPELPSLRNRRKNNEVITFFRGQSTFKYYPEDIQPKLMWVLSQEKMSRTYFRESINLAISGEQVSNAGKLPEVPLVVITRGKRVWPDEPYGNMLENTWSEMQRELAGLLPGGRQIIAIDSDHLIHLEQPEVVASSIMSVVEQVRQQTPTFE